MSICLTSDELSELTGRVRPSAQAKALNAMGIDHMVRPDGSLAVYRSVIEPGRAKKRQPKPDYNALTDVA